LTETDNKLGAEPFAVSSAAIVSEIAIAKDDIVEAISVEVIPSETELIISLLLSIDSVPEEVSETLELNEVFVNPISIAEDDSVTTPLVEYATTLKSAKIPSSVVIEIWTDVPVDKSTAVALSETMLELAILKLGVSEAVAASVTTLRAAFEALTVSASVLASVLSERKEAVAATVSIAVALSISEESIVFEPRLDSSVVTDSTIAEVGSAPLVTELSINEATSFIVAPYEPEDTSLVSAAKFASLEATEYPTGWLKLVKTKSLSVAVTGKSIIIFNGAMSNGSGENNIKSFSAAGVCKIRLLVAITRPIEVC
jgi:hypothetical protein